MKLLYKYELKNVKNRKKLIRIYFRSNKNIINYETQKSIVRKYKHENGMKKK